MKLVNELRDDLSPGSALLDVNLLVALFDPDHIHHTLAHDWFADHRQDGWATCPMTENGFVRVLANPGYRAEVVRAVVLSISSALLRQRRHVFWPDAVSLAIEDVHAAAAAVTRQVTDVYLLGLAEKMGGGLATFDRTIPIGAVVGSTRSMLAIVSADS